MSYKTARCNEALVSLVVCLVQVSCIATDEPTPGADVLRIATVLPFTGARASSGVPLESALWLAIKEVNEAGGLGGRTLWLDVEDSHSDDARGTANALDLIGTESPSFFIGTEEPKIAYQITSAIKAHQMVHLMPGLTSPRFHDPSADAAWFRLSPSGTFLACALAKHVLRAGIATVSPVVDPDDYSSHFAAQFGQNLSYRGGTAMPTMQVASQSTTYADTFATLARMAPAAVVLITSPAVAAEFLQEWVARKRPFQVYLGPTLNSPELLRNVPQGVLEGVRGISADLGEQAARFDSYIMANTSIPSMAGAHYYFDTVALLSLALAEGIAQTATIPSPTALRSHMLNVTSAGGTAVAFDELSNGLALLASRQKIQYHGAAGTYVLNELGDSTSNGAVIWQINGTEFVSVASERCDVTELNGGGHAPEF